MVADSIASGSVPGVMHRIVEMYDSYYGSRWGFDAAFTRKNVVELTDFLDGLDTEHDGLWIARADRAVEGSVAIDGSRTADGGATELRWFLVSDSLRGHGAGSGLPDAVHTFCRDKAFTSVHLWTFAGLDHARRLYDDAGFVLHVASSRVRVAGRSRQ